MAIMITAVITVTVETEMVVMKKEMGKEKEMMVMENTNMFFI